MMFSNLDIQEVLNNGSLKIEPLFEGAVRPAGVRLHLGELLLKPEPGITVDVHRGILPHYHEIKMTEEEGYVLQPGEFLLAATYEKVSVGNNIGFLIEGRSTLARLGLTIVQTAMIVYPGHTNRSVTLELANHGPNPIRLYPRMKIARAAIFELKSACEESYDTSGKYRDQKDVGPPIFSGEIVSPIKK
ncbi:MAG TPA: dCTP deaminase [Oligoflexia bacterium]|nr:dCTP deaminase [Oligoflexia bacterium]HMP49267.1 dCTP deaminase [Oligoflexia bacterium]